ncbi:MAG: cellulase family glycosylhydrolase [Flavobacteriaceae bacterium]|nr:cellulase family glycosylhydrolase [Flavobacteriaceae bacterium]
MKRTFFLPFVLLSLMFMPAQAQNKDGSPFVSVEKGHFKVDGKPYYYIGTNFWFGAILGSEGRGGNRDRLLKELDLMKEHGFDNLRVLVGAEGPDNKEFRVTPTLQTQPGIYNDTILRGLDFLLTEMGKRKMKAILFLNNSWDWSGGLVQYLSWNGYPTPPVLGEENGWTKYQAYTTQYYECEPCNKQFQDHIRFILNRTNSITKKAYIDDPAIMAWEIANEPRVFSEKNKTIFEAWIKETAALIKSLDKKHLVTTGSEGQMGSEGDMDLFKRIHSGTEIDYLTIHIWPKNWSWIKADAIPQTLENAINKTNEYISNHAALAQSLNKPMVIEEFGLPRDEHKFSVESPTTNRDRYYSNIFEKVLVSAKENGNIAGANFWAYGGLARPNKTRVFWKPGDDLMGDPGQEEQGLNSVFDTDTTMRIVKEFNQKIQSITFK